jgi:uncharacterized membrane protein YeaQ/YmgE (transglycosylase-associated protein family)
MYLSGESLIIILLVGLVAGWLAGKIVTGWGFGLIGNIAIGIVGALVGTWLLPRLGVRIGSGVVTQIIVATIGAILVLVVIGSIRGGYPRRRFWRRW